MFWGAVGSWPVVLTRKLSTVVSFSESTMAVLVVLFCVKVFVVGSVARISGLQSLFVALV